MLNFLKFAAAQKISNSDIEILKKIGSNYLKNLINTERGLWLKVQQYKNLSSDTSRPIIRPEPIEFKLIKRILDGYYGEEIQDIFSNISEVGYPASMAQVHKAFLLKEKKDVALKIQYPGIQQSIQDELDSLKKIPNLGPVKAFQVPVQEYFSEIDGHIQDELNFKKELNFANRLRAVLKPTEDQTFYIPQYYSKYCCDQVLVMDWIDGVAINSFFKIEQNLESKRKLAEKLLELFLRQLLQYRVFQSDFNPENFLVKNGQIILIDFGSYKDIPESVSAALYELIESVIQKRDVNFKSIFMDLGFDENKLTFIEEKLPLLVQVILEPFLSDRPFDLSCWTVSYRLDQILSSKKWWFRSAGSPQFFHIMRSFALLVQTLGLSSVNINWLSVYKSIRQDFHREKKQRPASEYTLSSLATSLHIKISHLDGEEIVHIELPISAIESIEEMIPEDVLKKSQADEQFQQKIHNLRKVHFESHGHPQQLLNWSNQDKTYLIWTA